jgi:diguanylate cyclase (GGDEF)-like protein
VGSLGARLAALSVLAFTSSLAAGGLATVALIDIRAAQRADARIDQVVETQISIDELAESLPGDVLAGRLGLPVDARDADDDVQELQRQSLRIAVADGTLLPRLGADEYSYAVRSRQLLTGPSPTTSELNSYLSLGDALRARVDTARVDLAAAKVKGAAESDAEIRRAVTRSAVAAVTVAVLVFGVGWWIRRGLLGSLSRLAEVARAVAGGDLAARTGFSAADEVGELAGVLDEMAAATQKAFAELDADAVRQDFKARFDRALAHVDDDAELADIVSRTLGVIDSSLPMELLIADSSEAHLRTYAINPASGAPGCPVGTPWSCPAVRSGRTTTFPDSEAIDACPHLRRRAAGPRSGVCMPVSFMGRVLGVLHATDEPSRLPGAEQLSRLQTVAEQAGTRLGTLRAFDRVQQQASLDGLTGLANRRSFENSVHALTGSGRPYGLLLADLDHFKSVNDTYGHAAGDRALRLFADVLRASLRTDDLACRYGGEEFAVLLPGSDAPAAAETANHLRAALAQALSGGEGPVFTVSLGAADSGMAGSLPAQMSIADAALLAAKRDGRDRCVVASASTPTLAALPRARAAGDDRPSGISPARERS